MGAPGERGRSVAASMVESMEVNTVELGTGDPDGSFPSEPEAAGLGK